MRSWIPVAAIAAALITVTSLDDRRDNALLRSDLRADPSKEVTLLSTTWCGYCERARRFLRRNGVAFVEIDVEREKRGRDLYQSLGAPGVPVLLVDREPIFGMDVRGWIRALEAKRS